MSAFPKSRAIIKLGVVGLGPRWERYYAPAVRALANRVRVVTVYDSVHARAMLEARDWACHPSESLQGVLNYPGIQAILLLDHDWYGLWPCELASQAGKLTLLDRPASYPHDQLIRLSEIASKSEGLVMTAFPKRHHSLTVRLRELLATRLGPLRSLQVELTTARQEMAEELLAVIDWCASVIRSFPCQIVSGKHTEHTATSRTWNLSFGGSQSPVSVSIVWQCGERQENPFSWTVGAKCQHGQAHIKSQILEWCLESGLWQTETVTPEKSPEEMLVDLVCRRVLGGIVPITDLNDALRGKDWLQAALRGNTAS